MAPVLVLALAAPARADATAFIGANTTPANRSVRGFTVGTGLLLLGFEFEYATTPERRPGVGTVAENRHGNVLLQTPVAIFGFQPYLTAGAGLYRERLGAHTDTSVGTQTREAA